MYRTNAAASRLEGEWGKCTSAEGSAVQQLAATASYRASKPCFVSTVHRRPGDPRRPMRVFRSHRLIIPTLLSSKDHVAGSGFAHYFSTNANN